MKKKTILIALICIVLSSCADVQHVQPCLTGHTYGFFGGLWHGWCGTTILYHRKNVTRVQTEATRKEHCKTKGSATFYVQYAEANVNYQIKQLNQ